MFYSRFNFQFLYLFRSFLQLSFGLSVTSGHSEFEWCKVTFGKNKKFLGLFLNYGRNISVKSSTCRNIIGCQIFTCFPRFRKMTSFADDIFRNMNFLCDTVYRVSQCRSSQQGVLNWWQNPWKLPLKKLFL